MKNQNQRLGLHMLHRFVFAAALVMGISAHAQTVIESVT